MKTVRQFVNGVLEAGNWDIRDAFDDIIARDAEHEREKAAMRRALDRLRTIIDEAFGMQPVMSDEDALTFLEHKLHPEVP